MMEAHTHIVAVTNQKGGVGKTTTALNLAASLAATKRRTLLIDLDPQGNATMGCGVNKYELSQSVLELLLGELAFSEVVRSLEDFHFDLLPANRDLTAAAVQLLDSENKELSLAKLLEGVKADYDYIIIDCPPTLNMLTLNALAAADSVLIPMQCEYYSLEGLTSLLDTIEQMRDSVNPRLKIEGILRTMYDTRNRLTTDVDQQLHQHFGNTVYRTVIPRNVRLAEAPSFGKPILQYEKHSKGAAAYLSLAGEMIRRNEQEDSHGQQ